MFVTILGKRWRLRYTLLRGRDRGGYCEPPYKHDKEIVINSDLEGERRLAIELHEMLHAADWHKDEEWVNQVADDIGRALWRIGYRLPESE